MKSSIAVELKGLSNLPVGVATVRLSVNQNPRFRELAFPAVLLGICCAAFGLLIPWLGFFQDDWYQIWFGRSFGSSVYLNYYAEERPFMAPLYLLTTSFVGTSPTNWQIFALAMRWLAGLSVYWSLRQVWPRQRWLSGVIASLFVIYPGFRQQAASVIYSHYFLQFSIQMSSIGFMALAMRAHRLHKNRHFAPFMALSLSGALVGVFASEYFFGLELIRPICLWLISGEDSASKTWERLKQSFGLWLPYLAILGSFLFWRLFVFQFPTYQPIYNQLPDASLMELTKQLAVTIGRDLIEMGGLVWALPVKVLVESGAELPSTLAAIILVIISATGVGFYLYRLSLGSAPEQGTIVQNMPERHEAKQILGSGVVGMLAAGWPFWFVGLPVDLGINSGSRFGIAFMLPASLILGGLVGLAANVPVKRNQLVVNIWLALLIGLGVGQAFKDMNYFRQLHSNQATFFQELAWRVPQLKPGTTILVNNQDQHLMSGDNALTAALNWIYDPEPPYSLDYMLFYIPARLESGSLPGLKLGLTFNKQFRTTSFQGATGKMLVVYDAYPHCLRVLDANIDTDLPRPVDMPKALKAAIPLSDFALIDPAPRTAAQLSHALFRYLPSEDSWCAMYEKADLARQQGDWQMIVKLAEQAFTSPITVDNTYELLPYIEGYARCGMMEKARELSLRASKAIPEGRQNTKEILCKTWTRLEDEAGVDASKLLNELGCR